MLGAMLNAKKNDLYKIDIQEIMFNAFLFQIDSEKYNVELQEEASNKKITMNGSLAPSI
jgi:hypothetical protein